MRTEFEKNMKIASELLSYCHLQGASEFYLDIKESDEAIVFNITASPVNIDDKEMETLLKRLQAPRRREMEQNYWGLGGRSEITSELLLIGMMVDDATVVQHDGALTIKLMRQK